jgi:amino acid adenylation domain-containing protein
MITEDRRPNVPALERRLRELVGRAWDHSAFYREIYAAHGLRRRDLSQVALEDLPVVSKADLMVRFDEAVTDPRLRKSDLESWLRNDFDPLHLYLDEYVIVHGSGGTNIYSYVPYTREAWRRMTATVAPALLPLADGVVTPLRSAFYFWTKGHYVGATSARLASHAAHEVLSLSVFDPAEEVWARLNAFRPERLHSYASAIAWLAEWTLEGKLRIAPRSVVSSGDRLTPAIRAQVKAAWNADIYDLYGACESVCMAARLPGEEGFGVFTESNLLEVVDSTHHAVQPGIRGRVLLTSLVNATLPIIRFDLHDYAVLGKVGFGAETLRRLDGKTYHALPLRLADSRPGTLEAYELAQLELPGITKIQFVAHSPVEIEIRYQSTHDLDREVDAAFGRLLIRKCAIVEKVTVRRVERIQNSLPAFKLESVVRPGQTTFAPTSLAESGGGAAARQEPLASAEVVCASVFGAAPSVSIEESIRRIAGQRSEHVAALDGERSLTYSQLDRLAMRVAGELSRRGFERARPVAVLSAHQLELLPLLLGVVRAGGFYLPLDSYLPQERLTAILADARPQFLLTGVSQRQPARALAAGSMAVLCLEEMPTTPHEQTPSGSPRDPACLLYTSGSTGVPKGVVLSHETIRARAARYAYDFRLGPTDHIALLQSYAVSAGVREIFGALAAGATLAFYDVRARGLAELAHWLNDKRISVLYAVPTLFRLLLETWRAETFPAVRIVRLGSEPVQPEDVSGFRRHFPPPCRLVNGYAATETDTICQYAMDHDTRIVAGRVAVGAPVAGVDVTLCDEQGNAAVDALGEIRVTSGMLAAGYWDARSCRVQPLELPFATGDLGYRLPDGRIFLLGRRDLVVKVHGHRVDLEEIERAVSAVPGVVEAAAILRATARGNARIIVFYVAATADPGLGAALRRAASTLVSARTIATSFVQLPALPRLLSGKVNRGGLPDASGVVEADVGEVPVYASDTEAALARIWREALHVPAVNRGDNFFDVGGDSIAVFRVLADVEKAFDVDLPIGEFFAHVELSELARAIDARRARRT